MSTTMKRMEARARLGRAGLVYLLGLGLAAPASANPNEIPCHDDSDLPCGLSIPDVAVQRSPAVFQFQARIAQAKLPVGDATFSTILVKLLRGPAVLCTESIQGVEVRGSLLNLTLGQDMDCELGEVLAESANLTVQVCLGGEGGCLKPIALATTPYAVKATWATMARHAHQAQIAARASYAHRATADREHFLRQELGAGYFDFSTPIGADAEALYAEAAWEEQKDGGFLRWTPVRGETATLHVAAKSEGPEGQPGQLELLEVLVFAAATTSIHGDLFVSPPDDTESGTALVIAAAGLHVVGDSDVSASEGSALIVEGQTLAQDTLVVTGSGQVGGALAIAQGLTVLAGGVDLGGDFTQTGDLTVHGSVQADAGLSLTGDAIFHDRLTAQSVQATSGLQVDGEADLAELQINAPAEGEEGGDLVVDGSLTAASVSTSGDATAGGDLVLSGALDVTEASLFEGAVTFEAGWTDAAESKDLRYVLAEGEERDLTFGGAIGAQGGLILQDDLDLGNHQLINFAYALSDGPPVPCGAETEGLFYFDTGLEEVSVCIGGAFRELGGPECGNGFVQPGEPCDDGNTVSGDGCSSLCELEGEGTGFTGWSCTGTGVQPTLCTSACGDGLVAVGPETCDDGGTAPSDGCDGACQLEPGWTCVDEPSACATTCGDGVIAGTEICDDGNAESGDGCDEACEVEPGWACEGLPSDCVYGICGDGLILADIGETCDDGNDTPGDGCSASCKVEGNADCEGEPSVCVVHGSLTFGNNSNCGPWDFTVPANVTSIDVWLQGGPGGNLGGSGRIMEATISVTPGEVLKVTSGSKGGIYVNGLGNCGGGNGAWGDGNVQAPDETAMGGPGGGYSGIFRGAVSQVSALVIAGGGGGGHQHKSQIGSWYYAVGGHGGAPYGGDGTVSQNGAAGHGATYWEGYAGDGHCKFSAFLVHQQTKPTSGGPLQGGNGGVDYPGDLNCLPAVRSGGGGGGYHGGGGGAGYSAGSQWVGGASGGGGSSYANTTPGAVTSYSYLGLNAGQYGRVEINW